MWTVKRHLTLQFLTLLCCLADISRELSPQIKYFGWYVRVYYLFVDERTSDFLRPWKAATVDSTRVHWIFEIRVGTTLMETPNFGVYNIKIGCQSQLRHQKWVSIKVDKGCPDTLDGCRDTNKRYHDTIFGSDSRVSWHHRRGAMAPSKGCEGAYWLPWLP